MQFGKLHFQPVEEQYELVADKTRESLKSLGLQSVLVSGIDETLADTAAFCDYYEVGLDVSANCVIVEAKRADKVWYAACVVLATTRADINGIVRRCLDARKISFAPMDTAISLTDMMYGGITPIGLPTDWPILVDSHVDNTEKVITGSGIRGSKLLVPGSLLASLPNASVLDIVKE